MVPFWDRCTTHLSQFSGDWDVHWGGNQGFDPWPNPEEPVIPTYPISSQAAPARTGKGAHGSEADGANPFPTVQNPWNDESPVNTNSNGFLWFQSGAPVGIAGGVSRSFIALHLSQVVRNGFGPAAVLSRMAFWG